jgi:hypothetical protein
MVHFTGHSSLILDDKMDGLVPGSCPARNNSNGPNLDFIMILQTESQGSVVAARMCFVELSNPIASIKMTQLSINGAQGFSLPKSIQR